MGAAPALLAGGIPDAAFNPIEGDTKEICSKYKRQNNQERETKQGTLLFDDRGAWTATASVAGSMARINEIVDRTNPNTFVLPRYWVASDAVEEQSSTCSVSAACSVGKAACIKAMDHA